MCCRYGGIYPHPQFRFLIHDVANFEKKVPMEWINDYKTGMKKEFLTYARPLIQAELTPVYIDGLPRHIYLK